MLETAIPVIFYHGWTPFRESLFRFIAKHKTHTVRDKKLQTEIPHGQDSIGTSPQWQRVLRSPQAMIFANHTEVRFPILLRRCFACAACARTTQQVRNRTSNVTRIHEHMTNKHMPANVPVTGARLLSRGRYAQAWSDTGTRQTRTERFKRRGGRPRCVHRHPKQKDTPESSGRQLRAM